MESGPTYHAEAKRGPIAITYTVFPDFRRSPDFAAVEVVY